MHATQAGHPEASLSMTSFSMADLDSGKLSTGYGHTGDLPGLPGSDFMQIIAHG
jgi:hypothetical protein